MKMPVIYSSLGHMDAVVTRWRGQLAENAKTIASTNLFPEMTHNEIVGWEHPEKVLKNLAVIMLRDRGDNMRIAKRMDIVKKVVGACGVKVIEVNSRGNGLLARIFSLIYIGDYVSFYLAILNKCDPTPVDRIAYLKKEMAK
jgi:glucose/mannose-6-phosphate isomerase